MKDVFFEPIELLQPTSLMNELDSTFCSTPVCDGGYVCRNGTNVIIKI